MESRSHKTLHKSERICGKKAIGRLLSKGRYSNAGCLRYCALTGNGAGKDRILVSVPKKLFRRAVKRNLIKRRMRESFRLQKHLLGTSGGNDIMFVYNTREIKPFCEIYESVGQALRTIGRTSAESPEKDAQAQGNDARQ